MLKKVLMLALAGVVAKVVRDKMAAGERDSQLWAEATDPVQPAR